MTRTLALRREALADLGTDDLRQVAGGAITVQGLTCPLDACFVESTRTCYSWLC